MSPNRFHTRQAVAALLKLARATSDPGLAAKVVKAAANLKDHAGELPRDMSAGAPDVQMQE